MTNSRLPQLPTEDTPTPQGGYAHEPTLKAGSNQADKRYELAIQDIMQIPEDRFDDFLVDLKKWHQAVRATLNLLDTIGESLGEKPSTLAKMVWIDDGKHDGKIIFTEGSDLKPSDSKPIDGDSESPQQLNRKDG